jgi:hypothetical protein
MAGKLSIPVALSSLLQVAWAQSLLPESQVCGVITIDEERLTQAHLRAVGAAESTPIVGMPRNGAFAEQILAERAILPGTQLRKSIEAELVAAAKRLPPNAGAIVLECTNLPPYRLALKQHTRLPVYDIQTLIHWFWSSLYRA